MQLRGMGEGDGPQLSGNCRGQPCLVLGMGGWAVHEGKEGLNGEQCWRRPERSGPMSCPTFLTQGPSTNGLKTPYLPPQALSRQTPHLATC